MTIQELAYLNDAILLGSRIKGILNITFTDDTEVADHINGGGAKHIVIRVGEGLRRRNNDRVACMYTKRIEIL